MRHQLIVVLLLATAAAGQEAELEQFRRGFEDAPVKPIPTEPIEHRLRISLQRAFFDARRGQLSEKRVERLSYELLLAKTVPIEISTVPRTNPGIVLREHSLESVTIEQGFVVLRISGLIDTNEKSNSIAPILVQFGGTGELRKLSYVVGCCNKYGPGPMSFSLFARWDPQAKFGFFTFFKSDGTPLGMDGTKEGVIALRLDPEHLLELEKSRLAAEKTVQMAKQEAAAEEARAEAAALEAERLEQQRAEEAEAARLAAIEEAKYRRWAAGNYSMEAKFISYGVGKVTLQRRDGKRIKVEVSKLSEEDQQYIESLKRKPKTSD
jgi:hypothetical protein